IDTTRLSEVMTGCGAKLTTCSRMSTLERTRSTKGTSTLKPGVRVRWYLPSRSTTSIRCWGTTRTERIRTTTTSRATIAATAMKNASSTSIPPHQRRRALDLDHAYPLADGEGLGRVVRTGEPGLALDLDNAVVGVDRFKHDAGRALDRSDAHRHVRAAQVQVP